MIVLSPAPERAAAIDRAAVRQPWRDGRESQIRTHGGRRGQAVAASDSELTLIVASPAERSTIRGDEAGVEPAGDDAHA